jgi:hypothetical protein
MQPAPRAIAVAAPESVSSFAIVVAIFWVLALTPVDIEGEGVATPVRRFALILIDF